MTIRRRQRFVHAQIAVMLAVALGLAALGRLTLEVFFIASLVGFLALIELTAPVNVTPEWRRRIRWLVVLGMLGFGVIVVRRVVSFLPEGLI
ncbi:hypothetical protein [Halorussus sp. AFM4]|uniref:hypothetical protein n=1 Tax=Halorussus sp. AFM4 TaxID=3421651 RepID=UPI003EBF4D95